MSIEVVLEKGLDGAYRVAYCTDLHEGFTEDENSITGLELVRD